MQNTDSGDAHDGKSAFALLKQFADVHSNIVICLPNLLNI